MCIVIIETAVNRAKSSPNIYYRSKYILLFGKKVLKCAMEAFEILALTSRYDGKGELFRARAQTKGFMHKNQDYLTAGSDFKSRNS